jgi:UDP-glucose 6-dehydrogenase
LTNICVIGLGRIGLSLALVLANANHTVIGVEKNHNLIPKIQQPEPDFSDPNVNALIKRHLGSQFFVTKSLEEGLKESSVVFIAINTGVNDDKTPDLHSFWELIYAFAGSSSFR